MKKQFGLIVSFLTFFFLFIPTVSAEVTVTDWDRGRMTQEEAQTRIEDLLDFNIEGKWTFVIDDPYLYLQ